MHVINCSRHQLYPGEVESAVAAPQPTTVAATGSVGSPVASMEPAPEVAGNLEKFVLYSEDDYEQMVERRFDMVGNFAD